VRANLITFQQVLSALDAVANLPPDSDTSDPFVRAIVAKAQKMLTGALDSLAGNGLDTLDEIRIELSRARGTLAFARERHESFAVYAEGIVHDIEHIDRNEVIVRLQSDQQVLEASYASLSRLQSLTLLDFI
jgi:flagellin-like hook-associated protein FlgL